MRLYTNVSRLVACVVAIVLATPVLIAAQTTPAIAPATLAGVVKDSAGTPIADAEVVFRDAGRSVRSGAKGEFVLADVPPGAYEVWIRRLGYRSTVYNWAARAGERTEIAVSLIAIPHTLDPVVVRAQEDKTMRGRSSIIGAVVDSTGQPVDEAEVQIVGGDRTGLTRANGGFAFRALSVGTYLVRVRKLGYAPNAVPIELVDGEEREVVIKIRQLSQQLDPVVVNEKSGYGADQRAWDDLEQRRRWQSRATELMLGPEELRKFQKMTLDHALQFAGVPGLEAFGAMRANRSAPRIAGFNDRGGSGPPRSSGKPAGAVEQDVCVLENGKVGRLEPLRRFSANDVELVEVYPSGTELSGTVAAHMPSKCQGSSLLDHPTYYVIWFKNAA